MVHKAVNSNMAESNHKLDEEFDQFLVDMKPHVLRLPHKTGKKKQVLLLILKGRWNV